ncbi:hypothetical protein [Flagellimonas lutaonensis]|uniref:Uncharacterized protein n=1 Tax=Flagellimonas lutaonensis TaxID=516051 RepID=A0A0D5YQN1_9FLAO|nr:hypothetical protein [Allomuricauda lutaonensis]AKA34198.1 hypothetical protein VC82_520 [Allomuricauda lutaonensis]
MKTSFGRNTFLFLFVLLSKMAIWAHPTGNMITVGEFVLWPYVDPVDDLAHHACVMVWHPDRSPKVLLKSEHAASDFMLYNRGETVYAIERRHIGQTQKFEVRILKFRIGESPNIIWDWFEDRWRIGEGGFMMPSDDEIVFGKYPGIYSLKRQAKPAPYFEFGSPINRIRAVQGNNLLLLGEDDCWLVDSDGNIIKQWNDLLLNEVAQAPLGRNQVFDADYKDGELLLAYWGNRSYVVMADTGGSEELLKQANPLVPHWVAHYGEGKLLFSSKLVFDGSNPKPQLRLYKTKNVVEDVWIAN